MSHFISQTAFYTPSSGFSHLCRPPISGGRIAVRADAGGHDDNFLSNRNKNKKKKKQEEKKGVAHGAPIARTKEQKMDIRSLQADTGSYVQGSMSTKIKKDETEYEPRSVMPGMTKEDVEDEKKIPEDWSAKSYGRYVALPENVEFVKIKVEVKDGVLYITIPTAKLFHI